VGSSGLAGTLRAAAVLLRLHADWDWFLTLNAADYPLVTQDGRATLASMHIYIRGKNLLFFLHTFHVMVLGGF